MNASGSGSGSQWSLPQQIFFMAIEVKGLTKETMLSFTLGTAMGLIETRLGLHSFSFILAFLFLLFFFLGRLSDVPIVNRNATVDPLDSIVILDSSSDLQNSLIYTNWPTTLIHLLLPNSKDLYHSLLQLTYWL